MPGRSDQVFDSLDQQLFAERLQQKSVGAGFPGAVESPKPHVHRQARETGRQFRAVAVSLDWKPDEALAFLEGFGEFDEVTLGGNWVGEGAAR